MTTSEICPQFLGRAGVSHAPLFEITFPVVRPLVDSIVSYMCCRKGYFLVSALRAFQSMLG